MHDDMALSTFLCLKTLQWADHLVGMDDSCILKEIMRECFRERRPVGEHEAKRFAANTKLEGSSKGDSTENSSPTCGLGGAITAHWVKQSCANFLWGKEKVM